MRPTLVNAMSLVAWLRAILTGVLCSWCILGRSHSGWVCILLALGSLLANSCGATSAGCWGEPALSKQVIMCICTDRAVFLPMWWELLLTSFRRRITPIVRLVSCSWLRGASGRAVCPVGSSLPWDPLPSPREYPGITVPHRQSNRKKSNLLQYKK